MPKLALAIIVKDEIDLVTNILSKYAKYFDEVALAVDKDIEKFFDLKSTYKNLRVYQYTWINDFSHKRNWLAERIESEYYFRIDTDDEIVNPENIQEIFSKMCSNNIDIVYFNYLYSRDEDGNNNAEHWRETIVRKRPDIFWKKPIHENLFIEDQTKFIGVKDKSVAIFHNITPEHAAESEKRNWEYLVNEYKRDGENTDPRTIAYIGRMLIGIRKYKEAIKFLELLVKKSGWPDDKYFAWIHMSQCFQAMEQIEDAIASCNEALAIKTEWPDAYLRLGELYIHKQEFNKAIDWLEIGASKKKPDTLIVLDSTVYGYRVKINMAIALFGIGDYEKAWNSFCEAERMAPKNEFIKNNKKMFQEGFENDKYFKNIAWIVAYTQDKDPGKLSELVKSIPKSMLRDERLVALKNKYKTPETWDKNSVVIYCGPAWEDWAAPSVLTGIGGSEEAVVYVSKELKKLGKNVTVYCSCGDLAGMYEGIEYKEYFEFNPRDQFDVLIAWRHNIFTTSIDARKKIIWLHDVPDMDAFPEDSLENIDKIMVLSEYHKSLMPKHVPDSKIFVSANGINLADFNNEHVERNPKRMIYTSSYDRGLQHILAMWPDVKKQVPDAELHIFYGWNTYDAMVAKGARRPDFKIAMTQLMKQEGVFEHGRVGHKQLAKEFAKSGVYAYPSHFEEISCISAMKAQASGCVPVVTDYAALTETVKYGFKIEGKAGSLPTDEIFRTTLIDILNDKDKQESIRVEMLANKSQWGWNKVAEQWVSQLFA